ncbi:MAG: efflux RND transporter periplasmic adaptor subunit [Desulfobacterales bacterium]|nr:efflux RND transporter periplasmic adaptor subunit [Desulfobacterales bacterium]
MKKRLRILIPIILIAIAAAYFLYFKDKNNSNTLIVSGNIEITEASLSFKIPGRLEKRLVDEGENVSQGQLIAILEKGDQELAIVRAEANLSYAKAVLSELEAGSLPEEIERAHARVLQAQYTLEELKKGSRSQEIASAYADIDRAIAAANTASIQLNQTKADFERFASLYKQGGISLRDYELNLAKYETAQNNYSEAQARVKNTQEALSLRKDGPRIESIQKAEASLIQAKSEYSLVKTGPRKEKIAQARAQVKIAEASVNQAKLQLTYTELSSPMDGIVLSKSSESGEFLNPASPVVIVGDIKKPWLRAYITAKSLGKIKFGDKVKVKTDSFPDKTYNGVISFISNQAEFTPKAVQTFEERVKLMYRIKINVENSNGELKPGMPADAIIFEE